MFHSATGRYVAVAQPDVYTKKVRKAARKLLCQKCGKWPTAHWKFWLISVTFRVNSLLGVLFIKTFDILPEIIMENQI